MPALNDTSQRPPFPVSPLWVARRWVGRLGVDAHAADGTNEAHRADWANTAGLVLDMPAGTTGGSDGYPNLAHIPVRVTVALLTAPDIPKAWRVRLARALGQLFPLGETDEVAPRRLLDVLDTLLRTAFPEEPPPETTAADTLKQAAERMALEDAASGSGPQQQRPNAVPRRM